MRVVLDTNCLIASLSRTSPTHDVWRGLWQNRYVLCLSNEILLEYQEIIARKTTRAIADNVIDYLLNSESVELITPYFHFGLIGADPDDNKFVDCAIAANATYIVSNDRHFSPLNDIDFPLICVIRLADFVNKLRTS